MHEPELGWSPDLHLERVYSRGEELRRRNRRALAASSAAVLMLAIAFVTRTVPGGQTVAAGRQAVSTTGSATVSTDPSSSPREAWTLRPDGIGPVTMGMSIDEAQAVVHGGQLRSSSSCVAFDAQEGAVSFTVLASTNRVVDRVKVTHGTVRTATGVGIGSTSDQLSRAYGTLVLHTASESRNGVRSSTPQRLLYLPDEASMAPYGISFELEGPAVRSMSAGLRPIVAASASC